MELGGKIIFSLAWNILSPRNKELKNIFAKRGKELFEQRGVMIMKV